MSALASSAIPVFQLSKPRISPCSLVFRQTAPGHPGKVASSLVFSCSDRRPHRGLPASREGLKLSMHESYGSLEKCLLRGKSSGTGKISPPQNKVPQEPGHSAAPWLCPLPCTHLPRMGSREGSSPAPASLFKSGLHEAGLVESKDH